MIFVGGSPLFSSSSSSQGSENLQALLEHPVLISATDSFKAIPERKISVPEGSGLEGSTQIKHVYIFQREYATVDPALVELVGTDEATTCVGLVIRNQKTGMTSVAHMDSPEIVDFGLAQMLSLVADPRLDAELDVHLIGGYEDTSCEHCSGISVSDRHIEPEGYSFPLCSKIVEVLHKRQEIFHIQTLCILGHNTRRDSDGNTYPIFNGFVFLFTSQVETSTGSVKPATFDRSSRCPDEIVRRIRVTVSCGDPSWNGKLLETYDTHIDRFQIAPCSWVPYWRRHAFILQKLSDPEILLKCSTSPYAEGPDFVDNERRVFDYLIQHPNWKDTFPMRKPRIFHRSADGGWIKC
ncbi:PREDICTED: protein N-terminal asparagine amidohydrolase isoform X2 [Nelumbo nucifera]|uniref:Protein N-terminal asparagine amidohydrolase isoform X2 n=1 Tax=Nelumbo nucifera TaxID=4432 RepID=A0A1U8Q6A3_NELNU|nr:PREDICTED: protein N-terminal asparagine amidohydrolase isoform X2 [Nelumbo nucifera]